MKNTQKKVTCSLTFKVIKNTKKSYCLLICKFFIKNEKYQKKVTVHLSLRLPKRYIPKSYCLLEFRYEF